MYILSKAIHINVLYATNNVLMLSKVTLKVSRLSVPCIWRIKKSKSSLHQDCIDLKTKINSLETCWLPCQRIMPDMKRWSLFPSYISWYLPFLSHFFKIWGLAAWIGYFQYIFFLNEILGSNFHLDNQIKNIIDSKVATNIQSVWKCWAVLSSAEQWALVSMATRGEDDPSTPTGGWFPAKPVSNPFHSERSRFCAKKRCPIA